MDNKDLWKQYALLLEEHRLLQGVLATKSKGPFPLEMYNRNKQLDDQIRDLGCKLFRLGEIDTTNSDRTMNYSWLKYL